MHLTLPHLPADVWCVLPLVKSLSLFLFFSYRTLLPHTFPGASYGIRWNLDVQMPYPFNHMMSGMSIISLDFVSARCAFSGGSNGSGTLARVLVWSAIPVALELSCLACYFLRLWAARLQTGGG